MIGLLWAVAQAATLDEALVAAEQHAAEVTLIDAGADAARAQVGQARAALLPKLAVSGSWTWNDEAITLDLTDTLPDTIVALTGPIDPIVVQPQSWLQASATAVVPILDLEGTANLVAAGRAASAASGSAAWGRAQLRVGVTRAFYGALLARDALTLAEEALAVATRQAAVADARVKAGASPALDALSAEADRLSAERDVAAARSMVVAATQALWRYTGIPDTEALTAGALPDLPTTVDDAVRLALTERADLTSARAQAAAARAAVTAAQLRWAPDVGGTLTGVLTGNKGFSDNPTMLIAGLQATWTLDGGYTVARTREASARQRQAEAAVLAGERGAEAEVRTAWAELDRARVAADAAARQEAAAHEAFEQAETAFSAGALAWIDLERATLGWRAARRAVAAERVGVALAQVGVLAAIGRW